MSLFLVCLVEEISIASLMGEILASFSKVRDGSKTDMLKVSFRQGRPTGHGLDNLQVFLQKPILDIPDTYWW